MKSPRNYEIEIKLRVRDRAALKRRLLDLGAREQSRVFEQNTLYDTPQGDVKRGAHLLRLRVLTPVNKKGRREGNTDSPQPGVLTFKSPVRGWSRFKIREEQELQIEDSVQAAAILKVIGLQPWFRYEKYRTRFRIDGLEDLHLDLDETPIGLFLELEGSRRSIEKASWSLGYARRDYITANYYTLYRDDCLTRGLPVADMVFPHTA